MKLIFLCCLSSMFAILLILMSYFLSMKNMYFPEKLSSFECGFLSFLKLRKSFSLRFFLIALIFIIFDIEIIFMLSLSFSQDINMLNMLSFIILTIIIFYGLLHEWYIGSLAWIK